MKAGTKFLKLTLANGRSTVIIDKEYVGLAMRLSDKDEKGRVEEFTRIIPVNIVINPETNWLDVLETPEDIMKMGG